MSFLCLCLQTFIFMGTGYSLETMTVKSYIRVLHETRCAERKAIRLHSDSNEKEKTSALYNLCSHTKSYKHHCDLIKTQDFDLIKIRWHLSIQLNKKWDEMNSFAFMMRKLCLKHKIFLDKHEDRLSVLVNNLAVGNLLPNSR